MLVQLEEVVQFTFLRVNKLSDDSVFVGDISEATREGKIRAYECTECNNQGVAVQAFCDKCGSNKLTKKEIKIFSLNLLPRITKAQSMDVLTSQANLAGYRAVSYTHLTLPTILLV